MKLGRSVHDAWRPLMTLVAGVAIDSSRAVAVGIHGASVTYTISATNG